MSELAPKAHMIHSIISNNWSVHAALSELVDNAFAPGKGGAEAIWIDITRERILVWDHGRGADDINRLFQLGNTSSWEDRSDIGLYGVGATHAAIWLAGKLRVTTVRDGRVQVHTADWDDCIRRERWPRHYEGDGKRARKDNVPDQLIANGRVTSGTLLEIGRRRRGGRNFHMDALMDRLGFTFGPGIRDGKRIFLRRDGGEWRRVDATQAPALSDVIEFESEVAGMPYTCRAGLMVGPKTRFNAFHYGFTHRILEKTREPFLDRSCSMLYAEVQLGAEWRKCIADHKNAVVRYREELAQDLFTHCEQLIAQGEEFERELYIAELETRMQRMVDGMLRAAKNGMAPIDEPPSPPSPPGPVPPEPWPPRPTPPRPEPRGEPGDDDPGPLPGVILKFERLDVISLCEEHGGQLRVSLNLDDANVASAMAKPVNSWGLMTHVAAAVTSHLTVQFVSGGDTALQRYLPKVARRVYPGMNANEVTAEIMTALMKAFPGTDPSNTGGELKEAA